MKLAALGLMMAITSIAQAQYTLVWSDEFDGSSINSANWSHQTGGGGWGNNEWQTYTSSSTNSFVSGGNLHIVATKVGGSYYSARLHSINKADFQYGHMEARIKVPAGQGLWPAFWMMPTGSPYGGWPTSGEIDILETVNQANTAHGTLIYGAPWPNQVYNGGSTFVGEPVSENYHVFRLEWEPDQMRWYLDGALYHTVNSTDWWTTASSATRAPFDNPFHFMLNVAVGGDWPGPPDGSTPFPSEMLVDYVRVYQLDSTPTELQNGGFEVAGSPADGWTAYGNDVPNVLREGLLPYEGAHHAKLFGQFILPANDSGLYQDVQADAGENWIASVWAAHESGDDIDLNCQGYMALEFVDANGGLIESNAINTLDSSSPTDTYQRFTVTATSPPGTTKARINVGFHQGDANPRAGAIYYDDATLNTAPDPCTPADITTQGAGPGDPLYGVPDDAVTGADINYFVNAWVAEDIAIADLTTQGAAPGDPGYAQPDGLVTGADIQFYVNIWTFGCP